jgi:ribonuclease R
MLARGERIETTELRGALQKQAVQSSRMERRAMTVERESVNLYRCILVKDRVGEEFEGTITGVTEHGLTVALDAPFVEARVPVERLGEDYYELDRLGIRLVGRRSGHAFELGSRITVRLEAVVIERREIAAVPASLPEVRRLRRSERPAATRGRSSTGKSAPTKKTRSPRPPSPSRKPRGGPRRSR